MPGRDQSGPNGLGPQTGRGLGICNGINAAFRGQGQGRGMGRQAGFRGRGFGGRGFGLAAGICGVGYRVGRWLYDSAVRVNQQNVPVEQQPNQTPPVMEQDPEKELLKQQTVELQKQVELLTQKLEQLENAQNPEKKA